LRARKIYDIPKHIADSVLFEADRTCCVCRDKSRHVQIHHLDGDAANHSMDNLVVLCLEHHQEASVGGGFARGLNQTQITKYRDDWLKQVCNRRMPSVGPSSDDTDIHKMMLDALACHDILKIEAELSGPDWGEKIPLLRNMFVYAGFEYGVRAKRKIISACMILPLFWTSG